MRRVRIAIVAGLLSVCAASNLHAESLFECETRSAPDPFVSAEPAPFAIDETVLDASPTLAISGSSFALPVTRLDARSKRSEKNRADRDAAFQGLNPERARILLQSLTVPGWGQASLGRRTAASVFGVLELGIWASFVSFKVQEELRLDSAIRSAELFAGIELDSRDPAFRRLVGDYPSSDDYNLFVVYRDAANRFFESPDDFNAYVAAFELKGSDAWSWDSEAHFRLFREQIKDSQRAGLRANTALGLAIANRIVSALHAARYANSPAGPRPTGWRLEPGMSGQGVTLALRSRF
ncbi:MAG: hypothetical protein HOP12_08505 [Candidatus Eisenbacteria bacterium]|uniref:DUF5683 domain-containing protein n=1 Tax=Eiseniibacteriota bacterium TaxID=2212470 RepID=A0A849SKH6_UNCEI|nr:hypothetical protein [Candidatus Eisenbacteria bacterium]